MQGRSTLEPELAALYPAIAARVVMTFVSTAAWLSLLLPRSRGSVDDGRLSAAVALNTEEQYSPIIETVFVVSSLIRRFRPQSVQAVVSAKSTDNQSIGEEEGRKMWPFDMR